MKSKRTMKIVLSLLFMLALSLANVQESASACSQIGGISPVIEKGELTYTVDGGVTGYVLVDDSVLHTAELVIQSAVGDEAFHFPLDTDKVQKDKIIQVKKAGINEFVDLQLYRVDFMFPASELDLSAGDYEMKVAAVSERTFCGYPLEASTDLQELHIEKAYYSPWPEKEEVELDHEFTIRFSKEIDEALVTKELIYIKHNGTEKVKGINVVLGADKQSIIIKAPKEGYVGGEEYFLCINGDMYSATGKQLKEPIKMKFTTVSEYALEAGKTYEGMVKDKKNGRYRMHVTTLNPNTGEFKADFSWEPFSKVEYSVEGTISGDELIFTEKAANTGSGIIITNYLGTHKLFFNPSTRQYEGIRESAKLAPIGWNDRLIEQTILYAVKSEPGI